MKRIVCALIAVLLTACGGPSPDAAAAVPQRVAAAGDSITLRTGLCSAGESLQQCLAADHADAASSWATYLPEASGGAWTVALIAGRGGDTCTLQAPWVGGVFDGQARGLIGRLQEVIDARPTLAMILIGINDVEVYSVPADQVVACVTQARTTLQAAGISVLVLTYPPVVAGTPVFGAVDAPARLQALNAALLQAGAVDTRRAWPQWAAGAFTVDGTHPLPAGAVQLALTVIGAVR